VTTRAKGRVAARPNERGGILVRAAVPIGGAIGLQDEELDGQVRIRVDLAHIGDHPPTGRLLDDGSEAVLHGTLEAPAHLMNGLRPSLRDQGLLDGRESASRIEMRVSFIE
jgi:hypothetical protein